MQKQIKISVIPNVRIVFLCVLFFAVIFAYFTLFQTVLAAKSSLYSLESSVLHEDSSISSSFSLCSDFDSFSVAGSSSSFRLSPALNCSKDVVLSGRRRRYCGNGFIDVGEQCDDANLISGDGCDSSCFLETPPVPPEPVPPVPTVPPKPEPPVPPVPPALPVPTVPVLPVLPIPNPVVPILPLPSENIPPQISIPDTPVFSAPVLPDVIGLVPKSSVPSLPTADEDESLGSLYLTNDLTALFFEQFPGGSGDYTIEISDAKKSYKNLVIPSSDGYFSLLLKEVLPDGYYRVLVKDNKNFKSSLSMTLQVDRSHIIKSPRLLSLSSVDFTDLDEENFSDFQVFDDRLVLKGETDLPATIAIYSDKLKRTFIVYTDDTNTFSFEYPVVLEPGESDEFQIVAHYEDGTVSREQFLKFTRSDSIVANQMKFDLLFWAYVTTSLLVSFSVFLFGASMFGFTPFRLRFLKANHLFFSKSVLKVFFLGFLSFILILSLIFRVFAAATTPNILPYEGVLKTVSGSPISTPHDFRFSFWLDGDFTIGVDRDALGAIPVLAPGYSSYSEVHTVTPDSGGFFQVNIGSITPIPDFITTKHLYLQVEIKAGGSPDTSYETLDIDGADNGTDRQPIGTIPYARNADFIDNAELGTSSGDIAVLGTGDVFPTVFIPGGTDVDFFEIDSNGNAPGKIKLSFGDLLNNQILEWDPNGVAPSDGWFNFTDDVNIQGNLTITGQINGVTIGTKNKSVQLQPEFENGVIQGDGSDNKGKMEAFFVDVDGSSSPNNFNYYLWTTRQLSLQDIDLVVRFRLPDDFVSFQSIPIVLRYKTKDGVLSNNRIDLRVEDSTGTDVSTISGNSALVSNVFTTSNITFGSGGTFSAGSEITIFIKMSAINVGSVSVSDLNINYIAK